MATSKIKPTIKTIDTGWIYLQGLTWTASAKGKYYLKDTDAIDVGLTSADRPIAIMQTNFGSQTASMVIQPYVRDDKKLSLLSTTNSFTADAAVRYQIAYL